MSTIEPTEEQWRAANNIADGQYRAVCKIADVAHLLAAREAKLQGELARLHKLFDDAGDGEYNVLALVDHYQKEALGADTLRARVAELEGRLARAVDIIVSEELDRDFGEEPTPRILAVRALLTECGYQPQRCSFGAVIGYSGTVCPKCSEHMTPVLDVEQNRWLCDRCHHPFCDGEPKSTRKIPPRGGA